MEEKYGVKLFHLEEEVEAKGNSIEKPINYSKREIEENIIVLDGVLNEGIDCDELRKLCIQLVNPAPPNIKDLKTRKLLQAIISISAGDATAKEIIAPLFYLNDLRVCFAHLISHRDFAFKKKSPILPIIYETKRGIKIRNKNYSFFMYKQSKRTPFRV